MKIYRILDKDEYRCFVKYRSLFNPEQYDYVPTGMLFPENADRFGKFFFFELEDLYNFVVNYSNATLSDRILELEIDRETALKYLSTADYYFFDPSKSGKVLTDREIEKNWQLMKELYSCTHAVPELYIDHDLITEKIRAGEYRIIEPQSMHYKDRPRAYFEKSRNPKTVELARRLKRVKRLRLRLEEIATLVAYSTKATSEKLTVFKEELDDAIKSAADYFAEFAREHEKYMALVPAPERQPE